MFGNILPSEHPVIQQLIPNAPPDTLFMIGVARVKEAPVLSGSKATYAIIDQTQFQPCKMGEWAPNLVYKGGEVRCSFSAFIPNPDAPTPQQRKKLDEAKAEAAKRSAENSEPKKPKMVRVTETIVGVDGNVLFPAGSFVPANTLADLLEMGAARVVEQSVSAAREKQAMADRLAEAEKQIAEIALNKAKEAAIDTELTKHGIDPATVGSKKSK